MGWDKRLLWILGRFLRINETDTCQLLSRWLFLFGFVYISMNFLANTVQFWVNKKS